MAHTPAVADAEPLAARPARHLHAPATEINAVNDTLHGEVIPDPYRWLEEDTDATRAWTVEQNEFTRHHLSAVPGADSIRTRLDELLQIGYLTVPLVRGEARFYEKRDGESDQPVFIARHGDEPAIALIDPNSLEDNTTSVDWTYPTRDGAFVAYGLSVSGSEQSTLYVMDSRTGEALSDAIPRTRACSLTWLGDNSGFYYTRYPETGSVPAGDENYHRHVYFHELGTDWRDDPAVFGADRPKENWPGVTLSTNDRWLVVFDFVGFTKTQVYVLDRQSDEWSTINEELDAKFWGAAAGDVLYVLTNHEAPRFRMLAIDLTDPSSLDAWQTAVPERESIMEDFALAGDNIVVHSMENASGRLEVFTLEGEHVRDIELPTMGGIHGVDGQPGNPVVTFAFSSYFHPPVAYECDVATGVVTEFDRISASIDPDDYSVKQVWYNSHDGTPVSMFLVAGKDVEPTGDVPTVLYGYGGFSSSSTPVFQRNTFLWLERGGLYAVPNLRGGGEYGEEWHQAGMLGNKQNTFDDFIAAAEWLIESGYTSRERLVAMGGSNGGLLVGAAVTQRPDLFDAGVAQVPLFDMLRYPDFLIGRVWITEYGNPADPEQFQWLHAYSPYHCVVDGTDYPAMFITAAESDSRVHPMHAMKMTARMQAATSSGKPILLRIETRAGHGQGKPRSRIVEEYTDVWTFIFDEVGVSVE